MKVERTQFKFSRFSFLCADKSQNEVTFENCRAAAHKVH